MMRGMLEQRIQQQFFESADLLYQAAETLAKPVADAAQAVVGCLTGGGKLLLAGLGPSAAAAQHAAAHLVARFERDRPGLAALALSADAIVLTHLLNETGAEQVFAKQVQALGNPGDALLVIAADDRIAALKAAVEAAHAKDMTVIALTGKTSGLAAHLAETDVHIAVPHERAVRVQELHTLALHCLCDAVDLQLLGEQDEA